VNIVETTLPDESILNIPDINYDYVDSYQGWLKDKGNKHNATDMGKAFFSNGPKWVESLFTFRNKVVSIFGLKTPEGKGDRQAQLANFKWEPGEQLGLFKVFDKTENELILGEDDKHLDFRISLLLSQDINRADERRVTISTTVIFNNWFGRLYFLPVRPFHKMIVPRMLNGVIRALEKDAKTE